MVQFPRLHFLSGFLSPLGCTERKNSPEYENKNSVDAIFNNLHENNLSLASFINLRTQSDIKNNVNYESDLLNSSGVFRLSDENSVSEIEMKYNQYCQNNSENSTHQAYSDLPRVNKFTNERYETHAAITVNSHTMKQGLGNLLDLFSQMRPRGRMARKCRF